MYVYFLSICYWLSYYFSVINGESGCDEVDILFLIDDKSIKGFKYDLAGDTSGGSGYGVIDFIDYIAKNECSEYSGFSVVVYGDNVPSSLPDITLSLIETEVIHQRAPLSELILSRLVPYFDTISSDDLTNTKSVDFEDAFKLLIDQASPSRNHYGEQCEKTGLSYCRMGLHDDTQRVIVFDYNNALSIDQNAQRYEDYIAEQADNPNAAAYQPVDSNDQLCKLIAYLDDPDTSGEALVVMEGQEITNKQDERGVPMFCDNKIPDIVKDFKHHLFYEYNLDLLKDLQTMDIIGDLTCPAYIKVEEGEVNLGNHVQWLTEGLLLQCVIEEVDNGNDKSKAAQLTPESYVIVQDNTDDDMTFKLNDYILLTKQILASTPDDCRIPVFKILRIELFESQQTGTNYQKLKMFIQLPISPQEYLYEMNAQSTDVPLADSEDVESVRRRALDLGVSGKHDIFYWSFKDDFEYEKEGTFERKKELWSNSYSQPEIRITAVGRFALYYGYGFEVDVNLQYNFNWVVFTSNVHFEVKIYGFYRLWAYFKAEIHAEVTIAIDNLLNWNKLKVFWIGPVPVLIRPFINLGVELAVVPITVTAGIDCEYKESWAVGYYYDRHEVCDYSYYNTGCWVACFMGCGFDHCEGSTSSCGWFGWSRYWRCRRCNSRAVITEYEIKENNVEKNGCTKELKIGDSEDSCPTLELGFDVTVTLKVGATLYEALLVYLKGALVIPFRLTVPEMDGSMCGQSSTTDMCALSSLKASFTIQMWLDLYVGYEFNLLNILDTIKDMVFSIFGYQPEQSFDFTGHEYKIATFTIMPKTPLGCLDLSGFLQPIDDYYRPKCCSSGSQQQITSTSDTNCNAVLQNSIVAYGDKTYPFVITSSRKVTFTNCESTFDTKMWLYDSAGTDITGQSNNNCDSDDCSEAGTYACSTPYRETFTYNSLSPGSYTIKLMGYSSNSGAFTIKTYCSNPVSDIVAIPVPDDNSIPIIKTFENSHYSTYFVLILLISNISTILLYCNSKRKNNQFKYKPAAYAIDSSEYDTDTPLKI